MRLHEVYTRIFAERDKRDNSLLAKIRVFYSNLFDNKKKLLKALNIFSIIAALLLLLYSYLNYDFSYYIKKGLLLLAIYFIIKFLVKLFHKLIGKWFIRENDVINTREYISKSIPRGMKVEGPRGVGKDTTISGIISVLRDDLIERILDEMLEIEEICYLYDFDTLNNYLDEHHELFMVNSKEQFFKPFLSMMKENNCFIKKYYENLVKIDEHIKELYLVKKNVEIEAIQKMKPVYFDGIKRQHFLALIIRYSLLYIRVNFTKNYVVTNQPFLETPHITAKEFCTKYVNIQEKDCQWPWPLVGGVIIFETEADAFHPSTGKGSSSMKTGMRNFKAFFRHLLGDESIWIQIGQKSKRTEKPLRELDESFISVIEKNIVPGGEKRNYLIEKRLSWLNFMKDHSIFRKEKRIKNISLLRQRVRQLENTGYIYIDIKVSRTDEFKSTPQQFSVKQLLRYDKPIYENYTVRLCFHIKDCFGRFNTHYLEFIAEQLAKNSKESFYTMPNWDMDLIMKKRDIEHMNYKVLDDMIKLDRKKLALDKKKREDKLKAEANKTAKENIEEKEAESVEVQKEKS